MNLRKGQVIDLEIESLAFGGAGIGSFEGMKVFVKGVMPGDKVKASFTKLKKNYAKAKLEEILEESKDRVEAKCRYANVCGGCQIQFMPYEKQLEYKRQHVIDCFERLGGLKDAPVSEVIPCENIFYYRNKMEFSFGYDAEMNFTLGMHVPGRRFDIMDLEECHLESPTSYKLVNLMRDFMREKTWPPFKYSCGEGFLKGVFIREGKRTGERMINLRTSDDVPSDFEEGLNEFVKMLVETGDVSSVYWTTDISRRGHPRRVVEKLMYGKKVLTEKMIIGEEELEFDILPQAFFQVNTFQAEILYSKVLKLLLNKPQNLVLDLFCGTGTIGMFLARHVEKVLGVELNESAVEAAKINAKKNKIDNIEFFVGDVAKVIKDIEEKPSGIVVDPPRAGLTEKMVDLVCAFNCEEIVYVSCNPATLARDCEWFAERGYRVKKVQAVDMFPHTYHIENVCLLVL